MRLRALVLAAGLLWPVSTFSQDEYANFLDGNKLYERCTSADSFDAGVCMGYVMGVSDSLQAQKLTCSFKSVSSRQVMDVTVQYLRDHPEGRHYNAYSGAGLALMKAFPCK